jgi:hypothetical protein
VWLGACEAEEIPRVNVTGLESWICGVAID